MIKEVLLRSTIGESWLGKSGQRDRWSFCLIAAMMTANRRDNEQKRWFRKSAQGDKWSFCLTAGTLCPRIRRYNEQTTPPEPHTGLQGEGGACRHQRRSNTG